MLFPVLFFCGFYIEKTESKEKLTVLNTKSLGQRYKYQNIGINDTVTYSLNINDVLKRNKEDIYKNLFWI